MHVDDSRYNLLELIDSREIFPGLDNFHTKISNDYDNFINYFDLSWFNNLTTRDAIVSYSIILGQISKKMGRRYISTIDDFLLWYRMSLEYDVSEAIVRYLLRKKMYVYELVRPLRILFNNSKTKYSFSTNDIILSSDHKARLAKFQEPLYLLNHISIIADKEGYMSALKFVKKLSRITQSLNTSMEGKLDKTPEYFVDRLFKLVKHKNEKEIKILDIIGDVLNKYIDLPPEKLIEFDDYDVREYFLIDDNTFKMILNTIHQNLEMDTNTSFNYHKLKTINDLNIYFTTRKNFNDNPPYSIFEMSENRQVSTKLKRFFKLEKKLKLEYKEYNPSKSLYDMIGDNILSKFIEYARNFPNKFPKKELQVHFLSINNQLLPHIFENKYSYKAKSFVKNKNYNSAYFDNTSFILELLFTQIITNWITSEFNPEIKAYSHFKRKKNDFITLLYSLGFSEDEINFIDNIKTDTGEFYCKKIIRRMKKKYKLNKELGYNNLHTYGLYLPYSILEKFFIFIYLEIINEIKMIENIGILKMYLNDWIVIYYRILHKWNISALENQYNIDDLTLKKGIIVKNSFIKNCSKICQSCNEQTLIISKFCEKCGNNLNEFNN